MGQRTTPGRRYNDRPERRSRFLASERREEHMKIWFGLAVAGAVLLGATMSAQQAKPVIRHVVVFKYKATATEAQIAEVTRGFRALKDKIPGIVGFEQGKNHSPEKLDQGFNHVYLVTFSSEAARDAYLPHPEHKKFGESLTRLGVVESVFVVDFTSQQ
jgi:hypothetical protein